MLTCTLAAVVQLSLAAAAADADSYAEAHETVVKTGKPMVIMVGTTWCGPCQRMKRQVLPRLRNRPIFHRIAFATINPDENGELARQITGGGPVPQLVMYRKTQRGWLRRKLIGGQSLQTVEKFIEQGVELDQMAKREEAAPEKSTAQKKSEKNQASHRKATATNVKPVSTHR